MITCPDCGRQLPDRETFVTHREQEHPPARRELAVTGIRSGERHGYQTDAKE